MAGKTDTWMRGGLLTAAVTLFASLGTAFGHSTPMTRFMNQYFLPANAQVSGFSGLLFGVLIPFGIVVILLFIGLKSVVNRREATALAVLLSLFIIPSGGYRLISSLLLSVFGLGNVGMGGGGGILAFISSQWGPLAIAIASFFVFAAILSSRIVDRDFSTPEYIGSSIGAFLVWIAAGGAADFASILGWGVLLILGFVLFNLGGTWAGKRGGFMGWIIALLGLVIALGAFSIWVASVLPPSTDTGNPSLLPV